MPNPYKNEKKQVNYKSFATPGVAQCSFQSVHKGKCEIVGEQTFKITFDEDYPAVKIEGATLGKPFKNPFSNRKMNPFDVKLYAGCDLNEDKLSITGKTQQIITFKPAELEASKISIKSSSNVIGVTDAVLTLKFTPITELPTKGTISLKIPNWYLAASTK